ncbi:2,3-bisphosphoglycerate-dependent phosphoglycerate mutase [uncultured archaeon]|nr:2,3-bisphosphoglycerate-dependent phosphoglycerate mutase [uncultured archaeon]
MKLVAFFIRHGETDLNKSDSFRGDIDIPLNEEGQTQAEEIPHYLSAYKLSALYHSGMQRTAQTLEPLAKAKGLNTVGMQNLNSLDTGDFAGKPKNEENRDKLAYYRDNPEETIPGGESVQSFRDRIDPILMNIIKVGEEGGAPSAACVHGSVIREISRLFDKSYDSLKVEPGGIIGVFKDQNGYSAKALVKENEAEEDMDPAGS